MAPKKKLRTCQSQITYHIHNTKHPPENNFYQRDYSETILHRLRPRIPCLGISQTVRKICAPRTRRKRTRVPVKRCSVNGRKCRCRRNNSAKPCQKASGDIKSRTVFHRSIQPPEMSVVDIPKDGIQRNSTSLIRLIRDYIFSTFREGTRWVAKFVFGAFRFHGRSNDSLASRRVERSSRREGGQTAGPLLKSQKEKTRNRSEIRDNQGGDGTGCSAALPARDCRENSFENNSENLMESNEKRCYRNIANVTSMWRADERNEKVQKSRKRRKRKSSSRRIARKKEEHKVQRAGNGNKSRYNRAAKKIRGRRTRGRRVAKKKLDPVLNESTEINEPDCNYFLNNRDIDFEETNCSVAVGIAENGKRNCFDESQSIPIKDQIKFSKKEKYKTISTTTRELDKK